MRTLTSIAAATLATVSLPVVAARRASIDRAVGDRRDGEAFSRSAVLDRLRSLATVRGPRLAASLGFDASAKSAR